MKVANFSNWGATAAAIAAPGQGILSTVPGSNGGSNGNYALHDGTSQAAAQVAGAAALLLAARRQAGYTRARAADVRDDLLLSARQVDSLKGKCSSGGVLDVAAAMARIPKEGPRDPKESAWLRGVAEKTATAVGTEGKVASTMPLSAAAASSSSSSPLLLSRDAAVAAAAAADAESRRRDGLAATAAAAGGRLPSTAHTAADAAALVSAAASGNGNSAALPVAVGKGGGGGATTSAAPVAVSKSAAKNPAAAAPAPAPSAPSLLSPSSSSSSSSSISGVSSFPEIVPGDRSTLARGGQAKTTPTVASASVAEDFSLASSSPKTAPLPASSSALASLLPPPLFG